MLKLPINCFTGISLFGKIFFVKFQFASNLLTKFCFPNKFPGNYHLASFYFVYFSRAGLMI